MSKEFFKQLMATISLLHPMRNVQGNGWEIVGCFTFHSRMYSFIISSTRGTWRCMSSASYANEWFDVMLVDNKVKAIIFEGKQYFNSPNLFSNEEDNTKGDS